MRINAFRSIIISDFQKNGLFLVEPDFQSGVSSSKNLNMDWKLT